MNKTTSRVFRNITTVVGESRLPEPDGFTPSIPVVNPPPPSPYSPTAITLAANLRRVRHVRGLGVRELARMADVQPSTITRIEQGESPNLDSVIKIATAIRVSLDALVFGSVDP